MHKLRTTILGYIRIRVPARTSSIGNDLSGTCKNTQLLRTCSTAATASTDADQVTDRVIKLVKKFDKIDAAKVTGKADFQKDLSLDSLDRVELVMAFEEEFSVEISDAEADKLKCCADVAKYVVSCSSEKVQEASS
ncbi:hypothetical protein ABFS83_08G154200 [Erythranthe nasuta]